MLHVPVLAALVETGEGLETRAEVPPRGDAGVSSAEAKVGGTREVRVCATWGTRGRGRAPAPGRRASGARRQCAIPLGTRSAARHQVMTNADEGRGRMSRGCERARAVLGPARGTARGHKWGGVQVKALGSSPPAQAVVSR